MTGQPSVCVVIPTLNAKKHLDRCLGALRAQDYPAEIVLVDAGSTDGTLEIAQRHGVERILPNPLRTGEAGKAVGIRETRSDLVLSIDSDNVVIGTDWLRRMVAPFADPEVIAAEVMRWDYERDDSIVNRWHALSGVADPLTLYVGNYARESLLTGRWTDRPHGREPRAGWEKVTLDPAAVPLLGANGFLVRRSAFDAVPVGDYHFDIDFVHLLVAAGHRTFARVDVAIHHYFCATPGDFVRKTRRRADDFFFHAAQADRDYPWTARRGPGVAAFILETVLLLPLLRAALRGYRRKPDPAWLFHVAACWITLAVYASSTIRARIKPRQYDRGAWRQ